MVDFKYNEGALLDELRAYVEKTYTQHYVGKDNVQSLDLIFSAGHGEGFTVGNVLKYGARYGKKGGKNRDDLLKILHYALLLLYVHDEAQKNIVYGPAGGVGFFVPHSGSMA